MLTNPVALACGLPQYKSRKNNPSNGEVTLLSAEKCGLSAATECGFLPASRGQTQEMA